MKLAGLINATLVRASTRVNFFVPQYLTELLVFACRVTRGFIFINMHRGSVLIASVPSHLSNASQCRNNHRRAQNTLHFRSYVAKPAS